MSAGSAAAQVEAPFEAPVEPEVSPLAPFSGDEKCSVLDPDCLPKEPPEDIPGTMPDGYEVPGFDLQELGPEELEMLEQMENHSGPSVFEESIFVQ